MKEKKLRGSSLVKNWELRRMRWPFMFSPEIEDSICLVMHEIWFAVIFTEWIRILTANWFHASRVGVSFGQSCTWRESILARERDYRAHGLNIAECRKFGHTTHLWNWSVRSRCSYLYRSSRLKLSNSNISKLAIAYGKAKGLASFILKPRPAVLRFWLGPLRRLCLKQDGDTEDRLTCRYLGMEKNFNFDLWKTCANYNC